MSCTVHFINDEWKKEKYTLNVSEFNEEHTAENIHDFLSKLINIIYTMILVKIKISEII